MMEKLMQGFLGAVMAALLAAPAGAEQAQQFGDWNVHYSAFTADMLPPEVAQSYDIPRTHYHGVLTLTVQRQGQGPGWENSVPAQVEAQATDQYQKITDIPLKEIREGQVVYYVGSFPVTDRETLDFKVDLKPQGADQTYNLAFRQQFFTD